MKSTVRVSIVLLLACCAEVAGDSAPEQDRVGFPKEYAREFTVLRSIYRADQKEIVTVFGNRQAASIQEPSQLPYPDGSVIAMEKASAVTDADGNALLDRDGRVRKREVLGIHVMRREAGFGVDYGPNRTGEWEYAEYRADGSYITPPNKSFTCAACHQKAGPERDWVFHGRFVDEPEKD